MLLLLLSCQCSKFSARIGAVVAQNDHVSKGQGLCQQSKRGPSSALIHAQAKDKIHQNLKTKSSTVVFTSTRRTAVALLS